MRSAGAQSPAHTSNVLPSERAVPLRRSRRIAEREGFLPPLDRSCTPPPAPRVDGSPPRFEGPRPAWLTGDDPRKPAPPSPHRDDSVPEPRVLPPLSRHALAAMPHADGIVGIGVQQPGVSRLHSSKHRRSHSDAPNEGGAGEASLPSTKSSPKLVGDDWPLDEPVVPRRVPVAPRIGVAENGTFPPLDLPPPVSTLVDRHDPEAEALPRASSGSLVRSATMRRELPLDLSHMPVDGDVTGLGITTDVPRISVCPPSCSEASRDTMADVTHKLENIRLASKQQPLGDANARRRVPLADKAPKNAFADFSLKAKAGATKDAKAGTMAAAPGPVDENGAPMALKVPRKRVTLPPCRPRSSASTPSMARDRLSFAISYSSGRLAAAPLAAQAPRPMYHLR